MSTRDEQAKLLTDPEASARFKAERNELAEVIKPAAAYDFWPQKAAELALAAGYRKPRTITTAEELDALGVGSVVRDAFAAKCVLVDADRDALSWRRVTTSVCGGEHRHSPYLPATVLWEPEV